MQRWLRRVAALAVFLFALAQCSLLITIDRFGRIDQAQAADIIIVLGAGLREDGRPTETMIARAEHGAALYHRGFAETVLCSGGVTRRELQSEAAACAAVLRLAGVPDLAIRLEEISGSTEENAIHAARLMRETGWQKALVVSSSYHLWRARWLFADIGHEVWTVPAPAGYLSPVKYARALLREVLAVNWQLAVKVLGLPWTDFPL